MTKRNVCYGTRDQTQSWNITMSGLARVREKAQQTKGMNFTSLLHHITPELLKDSYWSLKPKAAPGIDGLYWESVQTDFDNWITTIHRSIHNGSYRPKPARRITIPKEDGSKRLISIQCLADKVVQQATVRILNQIYEVDFMGFSYGFRPGRSQHDALDALSYAIVSQKVNWVLDLDIQRFFDTVPHEELITMVKHRVQDNRIVKLITRWLKVGIQDETGTRQVGTQGIPQGAVISPLLSNIYLHYVFDLWCHQWRRRRASGDTCIIRYADDAVVCFQYESDANRFRLQLSERMRQFGLTLHPDKTALIRFGRFAIRDEKARSGKKPGVFQFLGFTHFCKIKRNGRFIVGRKTNRKKLRKQIK